MPIPDLTQSEVHKQIRTERRAQKQPLRLEYAKKQIEVLGFKVFDENQSSFKFEFKGHTIIFYPFTGWASGKTIKDGHGLATLIKQLKEEQSNEQ